MSYYQSVQVSFFYFEKRINMRHCQRQPNFYSSSKLRQYIAIKDKWMQLSSDTVAINLGLFMVKRIQ